MKTASYLERSHPDFNTEQREAIESELSAVAAQIEAHRQSRTPLPSDRSWAKDWPALGSAKTWAKVREGDFSDVNAAAQLPNYKSVLSVLSQTNRERTAEVLYNDLGGAQAVALASLRLMLHEGKDRLILVEGGSGSGKTSSLDLLSQSRAGGTTVYRIDAKESWKSCRVAIRAMLLASGFPEAKIPADLGMMWETLMDWIRAKGRVTFAIDEAHHVSGSVLNLFKTLINETDVRLIVAGMATLLQKLRASASEEAKQLIHNRLFCRIVLSGPDEAGVKTFLSRRLGCQPTWKTATLSSLAGKAVNCGHWSFLRRIVAQLTDAGNREPDDAALLQASERAALEIS